MQLPTNTADRLARRAEALALDPYSPMTPMPHRADSAKEPLRLAPYSPIVAHEPNPKKGSN